MSGVPIGLGFAVLLLITPCVLILLARHVKGTTRLKWAAASFIGLPVTTILALAIRPMIGHAWAHPGDPALVALLFMSMGMLNFVGFAAGWVVYAIFLYRCSRPPSAT
jgi:hypothetical protein